MLQRIRSIGPPAVDQGFGRKRDYFEGWYFKSVTADERSACAVISSPETAATAALNSSATSRSFSAD